MSFRMAFIYLLSLLTAVADEPCEARMAKVLEAAEQRWNARFEALSAEVRELRAKQDADGAKESDGDGTITASLQADGAAVRSSAAVPGVKGRRLSSSAPTCCRWAEGVTCPASQSSARFFTCTSLHEYLEHKTTTHVFEDVDACLGSDDAAWSWRYDTEGTNAGVVLSSGGSPVVTVPTPLKVTHDASCSALPKMELQLDTNAAGSFTINNVDVMARMLAFARPLKLSYPTKSDIGSKVGLGSDARNVIVLQTTLGGTGLGGGIPQEDGIVIEATSASGATDASATEKTWFAVNAAGNTGAHYGYLKMIEFKVTCTSGTDLYLKPISAKYKQYYVGGSTETYKYFDAGAINAMWGSGTMTATTLADYKDGSLYALASVTFIII